MEQTMYTTTHHETLASLRKAIKAKTTTHVYIEPRFGCVTVNMRVTKKQALDFLNELAKDTTPSDCEMGSGTFGFSNNFGEVYIG